MHKAISLMGLGIAILCGCAKSEGRVNTLESNGNQIMDNGETTEASLECQVKSTCSQGMWVEWRTCLVEKIDGREIISEDLNGKLVCASFRTTFTCESGTLIQGTSQCTDGYCMYNLGNVAGQPGTCGWRLEGVHFYNEDGTSNDDLTPETLEEFGYELLPFAN